MTEICRSCLQSVEKQNFFYIDTFDNSEITATIPKDILQLCIPEMDLYISEHPGICRDCLNHFENFYNFKNRCLASEEKVLLYIKKHQVNPQSKINLEYVINDIDIMSQEIKLHEENNILTASKSDDIIPVECEEMALFPCNTCSFVTMDKRKLLFHKCLKFTSPTEKRFKCSQCDYATSRRYRLLTHVKSKHTPRPDWVEFPMPNTQEISDNLEVLSCPLCEFTTISPMSLRKHRISTHGPIINYCQYCPYSTKDRSNFRKHLFVHGNKPKKCTRCSYQCTSPYQLQKHYKNAH